MCVLTGFILFWVSFSTLLFLLIEIPSPFFALLGWTSHITFLICTLYVIGVFPVMRLAFLFCRIICRHPKVHFYVIKCAHLCDLFLVIFFYSFETQSYPSLQSFDRSSILHSLVLLLRFCTLILLESVVSLIPFVRYLILIYLRLYFSDILFCVSVLIFFFFW